MQYHFFYTRIRGQFFKREGQRAYLRPWAAKFDAFNSGSDTSDSVFSIVSPSGGIAPTTLRDFDQPGSQPFESGILNPPEACEVCHGNYDPAVEPFHNWQGSMMAQASLDPIFKANIFSPHWK